MASIVLILSHPSLDHPEATVRTRFVGQSRSLWNIGGHGPGIFALKGFNIGVGRDGIFARREPPCNLAWGQYGSGETESAPDRDLPATLVNGGSSASCFGRNRPR